MTNHQPVATREPQRGLELSFKDPVFGSKILITQKEFLVHRPGNVGQNTHPIHNNPHRRLELISQLYVSIEVRHKRIVAPIIGANMLISKYG